MKFYLKGVLFWAGLLALGVRCAVVEAVPENPGSKIPHRNLVDGYQFKNQNFYDERTGAMRDFLENLRSSDLSTASHVEIKTKLDPDNTATTGNGESIENINDLLPTYDPPVVNEEVQFAARAFQNSLKNKLDSINLNIFSEDPDTFLGDHSSYYLIIKKRGLIFYYLSRIVIYGLIVYLMIQFIYRDFHKEKYDSKEADVSRKVAKLSNAQFWVLVGMTVCSIGVLLYIEKPKGEIEKTFSDLYVTFKQISIKIGQIIARNKSLNSMNLKIPGQAKGKFSVQDRLQDAQATAENDLSKVGEFLDASRQLKAVSDNVPAIALSILALVLLGSNAVAFKHKSSTLQLTMFILSLLGLGFLFNSLDKFVVGLSGINDFCIGVLRYNRASVLPYQGYGITNFLGCSVENPVFQQLHVNTVAQNAALLIFNAQMKGLGRETVKTPSQAIKMTNYLRSLDMSNEVIDSYTKILERNSKTMQDLMDLNGCNIVRQWIDDTQRDLCLSGSRNLLRTLAGYLLVCFFLMAVAGLSLGLMWWYVQENKKKEADNFLLHADHFDNRFITE